MMFSKEDFKIESFGEFLEFAPIFIFMGFGCPNRFNFMDDRRELHVFNGKTSSFQPFGFW